MPNCFRIVTRIIPNFFVFVISIFLIATSEFIVLPSLITLQPQFTVPWRLYQIVVFVIWMLWLICWLQLALCNPGRIADDLQRRGLLTQVLRGDIPKCLAHLHLCQYCRLPHPLGAFYCEHCDACHLRLDHHCGVTGQCVADRNFKFFALNFFYGGLCGLVMFVPAVVRIVKDFDMLSAILMVYSFAMCLLLFISGESFVVQNFNDAKALFRVFNEGLSARRYLWTMGRTWWWHLVPVQGTATDLAWPGVDWSSQDSFPL
jgi:hypothetical protein